MRLPWESPSSSPASQTPAGFSTARLWKTKPELWFALTFPPIGKAQLGLCLFCPTQTRLPPQGTPHLTPLHPQGHQNPLPQHSHKTEIFQNGQGEREGITQREARAFAQVSQLFAPGCSHAHTAAKHLEKSTSQPGWHMETSIFPNGAALSSQQIMKSKIGGWS